MIFFAYKVTCFRANGKKAGRFFGVRDRNLDRVLRTGQNVGRRTGE